MSEKSTYYMEFVCSNCGYKFRRDIDKGRTAKGNGGTCDYCGSIDYGSFFYHRPLCLLQAEGMRNVAPMPKKENP